jgi:hypothetical protein
MRFPAASMSIAVVSPLDRVCFAVPRHRRLEAKSERVTLIYETMLAIGIIQKHQSQEKQKENAG